MRLLWRSRIQHAPRRGPQARISVDDIVEAGIDAADRGGIEDVKMRDIAQALGTKVMTLYTHVPEKDMLLELMIDAVAARFQLSIPPGASVEQALRTVLDANYRFLLRHSWLMDIHSEQPPLGPGSLGKYEQELGALEPFGIADETMDAVLTFLQNFARAAAGDSVRRQAAATSNVDWWGTMGPLLSQYVEDGEYPLAARVGAAAGASLGGAYNADAAYEFGEQLIVDAACALIRR